MAKTINKFIVKLGDVKDFKPKLAVAVSAVKNPDQDPKDKKKVFMVKIVHPNYKVGEDKKPILENGKKVQEIIYQEEFVSTQKDEMKAFLEALTYGKQTLLNRPDILEIAANTIYVEQLFIPQGRRGKMKLKLKDGEEAMAEREAMRIASDEESVAEEMDMENEELEDMDHTPVVEVKKGKVKKEKVAKVKVPKEPKPPKEAKVKLPKEKKVVSATLAEAAEKELPQLKKSSSGKSTLKDAKKTLAVAKSKNNVKNKKVTKKVKAPVKQNKNKKKKVKK